MNSMASVSLINHNIFYHKHNPITVDPMCKHSIRIIFKKISCQNLDPLNEDKEKKDQNTKNKMLSELLVGNLQKFGKGLKDNLSPKQKGDWKDLTLMSLSFAVYVYMSQKIVCAYCAWMSIGRPPW